MRALRLEAADISPDAVVYLREAVSAFYMDCLLSTCVLLSVAAEGEFLRLLDVAKTSKAHGRLFNRIGEGLTVTAKISQFKEAMRPLLPLFPREATYELDLNLDMIQLVISAARSGSGRPAGAAPAVARPSVPLSSALHPVRQAGDAAAAGTERGALPAAGQHSLKARKPRRSTPSL